MDKKEAKQILIEQGRFTYKVEGAREISEAFGLDLDESLIRTNRGYREDIADSSIPRVTISSLAKNICTRLGKKPNEKKLATANSMGGEGSYHDLFSEAHAMNL